ncbi:hypothetical protein P8452_67462 [Trifolium repens]|nr:hypothetical protein P8452_67462 [Trifolium repens]
MYPLVVEILPDISEKRKEKKKKTKHTNDVVAIASEIYEIDRGGAVVVVLELCNSEPFSSLFLSGDILQNLSAS